MSASIGHNSGMGSEAADLIRSYAERVGRLKEEIKGIQGDIKDIMTEAKGRGFDPKQLKKAIALSEQDAEKRKEENEVLRRYCIALGLDDIF